MSRIVTLNIGASRAMLAEYAVKGKNALSLSAYGSVDLAGYQGILNMYSHLTEQIDGLNKEREAIAQQIKQFMGDAEQGRCTGYKVRWSNTTRRTLDTKALNAAMLGALDSFYRESYSRRFLVTKEG